MRLLRRRSRPLRKHAVSSHSQSEVVGSSPSHSSTILTGGSSCFDVFCCSLSLLFISTPAFAACDLSMVVSCQTGVNGAPSSCTATTTNNGFVRLLGPGLLRRGSARNRRSPCSSARRRIRCSSTPASTRRSSASSSTGHLVLLRRDVDRRAPELHLDRADRRRFAARAAGGGDVGGQRRRRRVRIGVRVRERRRADLHADDQRAAGDAVGRGVHRQLDRGLRADRRSSSSRNRPAPTSPRTSRSRRSRACRRPIFHDNLATSTTYYYRVRATNCGSTPPFSRIAQTVVQAVPPRSTRSAEAAVPFGSTTPVQRKVFVPGRTTPMQFRRLDGPGAALRATASTPW